MKGAVLLVLMAVNYLCHVSGDCLWPPIKNRSGDGGVDGGNGGDDGGNGGDDGGGDGGGDDCLFCGGGDDGGDGGNGGDGDGDGIGPPIFATPPPCNPQDVPIPQLSFQQIIACLRLGIGGEPHYLTFDGNKYDFHGTCNYVLVESTAQSLTYFRVLSENHYGSEDQRSGKVSTPKNLWLELYGFQVVVSYEGRVIVNGVETRMPIFLGTQTNYISVVDTTDKIRVVTDFGLNLAFSGLGSSEINIPQQYDGMLQGMLGNSDGNPRNDAKLPDNSFASNAIEFGNGWKDSVLSNSRCDDGEERQACCETQEELDRVNDMCSGMSDQSGPFKDCHGDVNPSSFMANCRFDMCMDPNNTALLCEQYRMYATVCAIADVIVDWRTDDFCAPVCMKHGHYELSTSPCRNTCENPDQESECEANDVKPVSGCVCDDGYFYDDGECVRMRNCGCWSRNSYHRQEDRWFDGSCNSLCTCTGYREYCCEYLASCPSDTTCVQQPDDTTACVCQPGSECFSECKMSLDSVMTSPMTQGLKIARKSHKIMARTDTSETDPCRVQVSVKTNGQGKVNWLTVSAGLDKKTADGFARGFQFDRWPVGDVVMTGHGIGRMSIMDAAWDDGHVKVRVDQRRKGYKLDVVCLATQEHLLTVKFDVSDDEYVILRVDDPNRWTGMCYDY